MDDSFSIFVESFDADKPYLYIGLIVLLALLYILKLEKRDVSFMLMNIILYTAITTTIFYTYTKSERRKITEKYINNVLSLLYDTDRENYEKFKEKLRQTETKKNDNISFIKKNITYLLGALFFLIFIIFYIINKNDISITSIGRNAYYLVILGLTEIFLTFFVITRIPLPNIVNLMDAFIRRRERCSKENIKQMISEDTKAKNCNNFKDDGDTCVVDDIHKFTCNNGRINRTRFVIDPTVT